MADLTLDTAIRHQSEIIDMVLSRGDDRRALVLTPADPIPARRIEYSDPDRRYDDHSSARWVQDTPTFERVQRVNNWGWLQRVASGYSEPGLVHPMAGATLSVVQWRYGRSRHLGMNSTGPLYASHDTFDPIVIARLSDGRYFANQWADPSVLYDALSRWRNARGYLCAWKGVGFDVTGAIGGHDWSTIPNYLEAHRTRVIAERERAAQREAKS